MLLTHWRGPSAVCYLLDHAVLHHAVLLLLLPALSSDQLGAVARKVLLHGWVCVAAAAARARTATLSGQVMIVAQARVCRVPARAQRRSPAPLLPVCHDNHGRPRDQAGGHQYVDDMVTTDTLQMGDDY